MFAGQVKMAVKHEQKYLGDVISADGKHNKNILMESIGVINQIVESLNSVYFGKYHFEVALILRSSLLLSKTLSISEAWVT